VTWPAATIRTWWRRQQVRLRPNMYNQFMALRVEIHRRKIDCRCRIFCTASHWVMKIEPSSCSAYKILAHEREGDARRKQTWKRADAKSIIAVPEILNWFYSSFQTCRENL